MGKYKYRFGYSFAYGVDSYEHRALQMFEEMSKEGYRLKRRLPFLWQFIVDEPMECSFSADYFWIAKPSEFESYKELFANAGWNYICTDFDGHHIFSATKGTRPIYTDKSTLAAKFKRRIAGNLCCFVAFAMAYTGSQVLLLGHQLTELLTSWVFWLFFLLLGVLPYLWSVRSNIIMIRRLKEDQLHTTKERRALDYEISD